MGPTDDITAALDKLIAELDKAIDGLITARSHAVDAKDLAAMRHSRDEVARLGDFKAKAHSLKQDWKTLINSGSTQSTPQTDGADSIRIIRSRDHRT